MPRDPVSGGAVRRRLGSHAPEDVRADYLQSHALRAARPETLPAGEGREIFSRVCARCHALPDPAQRTAEEWPAVVERMRTNIEAMEEQPITDEEVERIVAYLRSVAAGG